MGYDTKFDGEFRVSPPMTNEHIIYMNSFSRNKHEQREGAPLMPTSWCQWYAGQDGTAIRWDGGEKFYDYTEWIMYLIHNVLSPRGYTVEGKVRWRGEDFDDYGTIEITDNVVSEKVGQM